MEQTPKLGRFTFVPREEQRGHPQEPIIDVVSHHKNPDDMQDPCFVLRTAFPTAPRTRSVKLSDLDEKTQSACIHAYWADKSPTEYSKWREGPHGLLMLEENLAWEKNLAKVLSEPIPHEFYPPSGFTTRNLGKTRVKYRDYNDVDQDEESDGAFEDRQVGTEGGGASENVQQKSGKDDSEDAMGVDEQS